MLDALALHDARGLKNEVLAWLHTQILARRIGVLTRRRREILEVHHIRHHHGGRANVECQLPCLDRIQHHMPDGGQVGREGRGQVVAHRVVDVRLALPGKIVVMRDHRIAGLGNELDQSQPEWQVGRKGQGVLNNAAPPGQTGGRTCTGVP